MADDDDFTAPPPSNALGIGDLGSVVTLTGPAEAGSRDEQMVTYHFPVEIEVVREEAVIDHAEVADKVMAMLATHLRRV